MTWPAVARVRGESDCYHGALRTVPCFSCVRRFRTRPAPLAYPRGSRSASFSDEGISLGPPRQGGIIISGIVSRTAAAGGYHKMMSDEEGRALHKKRNSFGTSLQRSREMENV